MFYFYNIRSIRKAINLKVFLRLRDNIEIEGTLEVLDINLILSDVTEFQESKPNAKYEKLFVRGNQVSFIKIYKDFKKEGFN